MENIKGFFLAILIISLSLLIDVAIIFGSMPFKSWSHLGTRFIELIVIILLLFFAGVATDEEYEPEMANSSMFIYAFISGITFGVLKIVGYPVFIDVGFTLIGLLFLGKILMAITAKAIFDLTDV